MAVRPEEIASILKQQIEQFGAEVTAVDVGTVVEAGDGIARVHGLSNCMACELVEFPNGAMGLALNLEEETVGVMVLGEFADIKEGDEVRSTGRIVEVPVGDALIGRVVDPLGKPLDGKGPVKTTKTRPVERIAPNVVVRTGGRHPRPDRHQGHRRHDPHRPRAARADHRRPHPPARAPSPSTPSSTRRAATSPASTSPSARRRRRWRRRWPSSSSTGPWTTRSWSVANASDPAPLQYLAPYSGCAMGEEFMEQGRDALIIYDDLSKHAWAYRQVSLLLRRPPGSRGLPGRRLLPAQPAAGAGGEAGPGARRRLPDRPADHRDPGR